MERASTASGQGNARNKGAGLLHAALVGKNRKNMRRESCAEQDFCNAGTLANHPTVPIRTSIYQTDLFMATEFTSAETDKHRQADSNMVSER